MTLLFQIMWLVSSLSGFKWGILTSREVNNLGRLVVEEEILQILIFLKFVVISSSLFTLIQLLTL